MTDDDRLAELFRAAASDPAAPAPGFGHDDVLAASRRITVRRRSAVIGGAVALFAVIGVGAAVTLPDPPTASSMAAPSTAAERSSPTRAAAGEGAADAQAAAPAQVPVDPTFRGPPLGPGTRPCADRQDPQLRGYLEQVLPEVVGAPAAASTDECRPGTQREVTLEVSDGGRRGLLAVIYLPPGATEDGEPDSSAVRARTASGGTVIVSTRPDGGTAPAPFADRLTPIAQYLAPRL